MTEITKKRFVARDARSLEKLEEIRRVKAGNPRQIMTGVRKDVTVVQRLVRRVRYMRVAMRRG